jgi:hypothetical protein
MRSFWWGLAELGLLAIASPAFAEIKSLTLDGHHFYFDIPPGYVESESPASDTKIRTFELTRDTQLIAFIEISVQYETVEEEFDRLKDKPEIKSVYLSDARIGYRVDTIKGQVGNVFTSACSGRCIIYIAVATQDASEAQALLQKYAKTLESGNFGGQ